MATAITDDWILAQRKAYRVPGSYLNSAAEQLTQKFGIQKPIEVFVSRSQVINAQMMETADGALRITVTEPLLQALDSSAHGPVSEELLGILGHELGHIKEGNLKPYLYGGLLPIMALPVVAVAARHYLDHLHAKQIPREHAANYLYTQADQESNALPYEPEGPHTALEKGMLGAAKDLIVSLAGLVTGGFVARVNSEQLEFRCDHWGAKASSPQAMINSFLKMDEAYQQRKIMGIIVPKDDPFNYGEVKGKVGQWLIDVLKSTVAAHPDDPSRIAKLERMAARL